MNYLVKFKNYNFDSKGTAQRHFEILTKYGKVLWGQWTKSDKIFSIKTFNEMNKKDFFVYALDRNTAILKMHVIQVLRKEDIIADKMEYLIPDYYSIETQCAGYFLIDDISVEPLEYGQKLFTLNGVNILSTNQIPSYAPWRIKEEDIDLILRSDDIDIIPISSSEPIYSVYKYTSKLNSKSYIGLTNNIIRRRKEHESPNSWKDSKKYLYILFSIQGLDKFNFEILETNLTLEQAQFVEAIEIEKYSCYYPSGLNERKERHNLNK